MRVLRCPQPRPGRPPLKHAATAADVPTVDGSNGWPVPADEAGRLRDLYAYRILDSESEESFDELVRLTAELFDVPVARINLIDAEREWTKADVGGLPRQRGRAGSFCAHTVAAGGDVLVVADATRDPRFATHPAVCGDPHVRFYAGAPLLTDRGHSVGALCVVDWRPRTLTPTKRRQLEVLAHQVVTQLELRRRLEDERTRVEELRRLDELRGRFVGFVAHEFRNPLAAIAGYAQLLGSGRRGSLTPEQLHDVGQIEAATRRLRDLVDELLATASLISGELVLDPAPLDLAVLVTEAADRAAASFPDVRFRLRAPELLPVVADARRLVQVLDNLISNAGKYTPAGGGVSVELEGGEDVRLTVADTGVGIPADEIENLFTPYYRASTAIDAGIGGTGLGLAVVRRIVEAHGGTVDVSSAVGRGTTFTVALPATP